MVIFPASLSPAHIPYPPSFFLLLSFFFFFFNMACSFHFTFTEVTFYQVEISIQSKFEKKETPAIPQEYRQDVNNNQLNILGVGPVMLQAEILPMVVASHKGTSLGSSYSTSDRVPIFYLEKQQRMIQALRPTYPHGRPTWGSFFWMLIDPARTVVAI